MGFKTLKYHYKSSNSEIAMLKLLCRISKNLYNASLYYLRQYYFEHKTIPSYFEVNKELKTNENFPYYKYISIDMYYSVCS